MCFFAVLGGCEEAMLGGHDTGAAGAFGAGQSAIGKWKIQRDSRRLELCEKFCEVGGEFSRDDARVPDANGYEIALGRTARRWTPGI